MEDFEGYVIYGAKPHHCSALESLEIYEKKPIFDSVRHTQYCGLTKKKGTGKLMASHPNDLYSSLQKLVSFVVDEVSDFENHEFEESDSYWRLWFWEGVLVVGGDLLEKVPEKVPGTHL